MPFSEIKDLGVPNPNGSGQGVSAWCGEAGSRAAPRCQRGRVEPMVHGRALCLSLRSEITVMVPVLTKKSRGFPSIAPVAALPIRQGCCVGCLLSGADHGDSSSNVPDKSTEFASDRGGNFVMVNPTCSQASKARAQANLRFPRNRHDLFGLTFESGLQ
jgi:hypothetical protein